MRLPCKPTREPLFIIKQKCGILCVEVLYVKLSFEIILVGHDNFQKFNTHIVDCEQIFLLIFCGWPAP